MAPSRGFSRLQRISTQLLPPSRPNLRRFQAATVPTGSRNFSYEGVVESAHLLLSNAHNASGLPWYVILPLTALTVRSMIALPTSILAARNRQQRATVVPALLELRPQLEREVIAKYNDQGPVACTRHLSKALAKKSKELELAQGIRRWPSYLPWLQVIPFLVTIDVIRRMTGQTKGLLGWLFGSNESSTDAPDAASRSLLDNVEGEGPATLDKLVNESSHLSRTDTLAIQDSLAPNLLLSGSQSPLFEPSLANEGCLWFSNLLVADPQLYLPMLLSAALFANPTIEQAKAQARLQPGVNALPRWSRALTKTLQLVALAMFPLTMHLPAAMLWYWLSSAVLGLVQKEALDFIVPRPNMNRLTLPKGLPPSQTVVQAPQDKAKKPYKPLRRASQR